MNNFREFRIEKCKSFGFTFSILFLLLSIYDIYYIDFFYIVYLLFSAILFVVTIFRPKSLRFFAFYWERIGVYLGMFFSPIILSLVYLLTIIPINLVIRILMIDLVKKDYVKQRKSYWQTRKNNEINFKDQF